MTSERVQALDRFAHAILMHLLLLGVCLSGCTRRQEDGRTEIVFNDHPYAHLNRMNRERIELFEKENPDIRVKYVPGEAQKLLGMIAGGVPPDVFITDTVSVPFFARRGVLMRLDDRVAADPDMKLTDFFDCTVRACRHDGKLYGLPDAFSPVCLIYNKNLFREAGVPLPTGDWTWDEFLDACKRLTKDRDGDGRIDQYGFEVIWSYHRWPIFVWQNGGEIYDANADRYVLDSPESIEAIQWLHDLIFKYRVSPSGLDAMPGVASQSFEFRFAEQRVAMSTNNRFYLAQMRGFGGFEIGICHLPRGRRRSTIMIGSAIMIHARTRHPDASWRFARFLASGRSQEMSQACGRGLPTHIATAKKVTHHPGVLPDGDEVFVEAAEYCRTKDFEIAELRQANWEAFMETVPRVGRNQIGPAAACREANETLNGALRRYRATGGPR
jgi:multiple sugar transport system substrate-binding protein